MLEKRLNSFLNRFFKKAWLSINRAFFGLCLLVLLPTLVQAKSYCSLSAAELALLPVVKIKVISDGDSLVLSDGRRLRLISVNTPELQLKQALALQAKEALFHLLKGKRIAMRLGVQSKDRYGRLLADLYLPDGRSIAAMMLKQGWGFLVAIPPNIDDVGCMVEARDEAKGKALGVWSLAVYRAKSSITLNAADIGFQRVKGKLQSFQQSSTYWWLDLEGGLVIRIDKKNQLFFDQKQLQSAVGRVLLVSGWVVDRGRQKRVDRSRYMLLLGHSSQLQVL